MKEKVNMTESTEWGRRRKKIEKKKVSFSAELVWQVKSTDQWDVCGFAGNKGEKNLKKSEGH